MSTEEDDEIPPLEDMSDLIKQVNEIREAKQGEKSSSTPPTPPETPKTVAETTAATPVASASSVSPEKAKTFGGFKKGFLSAKPATEKSVKSKVERSEPAVPLIKPKDPNAKKKVGEIPEVQEAMKASSPLLENQDWITEDLLTKLQQNPALTKHLMDPRITQALSRMQSDPKAAWETLNGDPEMQKILKEFSGILGEHFTKLGDKENKQKKVSAPQNDGIGLVERSTSRKNNTGMSAAATPSPEEEERMHRILQDPQNMEILADPRIQQLIADLRNNPASAQETMKNAPSELHAKIRRLVDVGLLAFA